ncbi:MAG: hypothetical protein C4532_18235 [Candidatus Abyssobacteria bacterium SURF_17]|uniref:Uncharacterized protein n=1 Tax=Candidatus Abyssobacteria bacterium SURF_17 TaxID=2093361 RepID=A0A419EPK4_9BACT|nr:MAG: hypothetical protein C4532_18235 [Candidatus Abyssubacteria bacterium SURF_17]
MNILGKNCATARSDFGLICAVGAIPKRIRVFCCNASMVVELAGFLRMRHGRELLMHMAATSRCMQQTLQRQPEEIARPLTEKRKRIPNSDRKFQRLRFNGRTPKLLALFLPMMDVSAQVFGKETDARV